MGRREEPGLIGSTEWTEHHAQELQQKAVVYVNTDGNGRGFLSVEGAGSLTTVMNQVAKDVMDPQTGVSVWERAKSQQATNAASPKVRKEILDRETTPIGALGSGSDFSGFIHHLGIPSLNMGFDGEAEGGEYHSIYDSYDHYKRFKDPKFIYGLALTKTAGRTTLRFANAEVLPFDFQVFQKTLAVYLTEVIALLNNLRESTEIENQMIQERRYVLASDPTKKYNPQTLRNSVPYLDFSSLQNAVAGLEKSTLLFSNLMTANPNPPSNPVAFNQLLYRAEQTLLNPAGLPRRPWYKHTICAPGFYTGYSVKTLPGVREAIEQRNWVEAQDQIAIASAAINEYAKSVDAANRLLMMREKP